MGESRCKVTNNIVNIVTLIHDSTHILNPLKSKTRCVVLTVNTCKGIGVQLNKTINKNKWSNVVFGDGI